MACGLALIIVLFVPLWQIELAAPQYPEGLTLKMHAHKLAGNVDIINGLNHYIGMRTLHTEDFAEFKILPYIIGFFAVSCLVIAGYLRTYKWLLGLLLLFISFGIIAMADFWRWEYQYGHDLDPNAAINVPGMSYQPPLIGYKQLLNFGAYSVPDIGGWIFICVGMSLLFVVVREYKQQKGIKHHSSSSMLLYLVLAFPISSCNDGPQPIQVGKDACSFCKMGVADKHFGAELLTKKGKIYKFDDLDCMIGFLKDRSSTSDVQKMYVVNYEQPHELLDLEHAFLLKSETLRSPMGSNIAGFATQKQLQQNSNSKRGEMLQLNTLLLTVK